MASTQINDVRKIFVSDIVENNAMLNFEALDNTTEVVPTLCDAQLIQLDRRAATNYNRGQIVLENGKKKHELITVIPIV